MCVFCVCVCVCIYIYIYIRRVQMKKPPSAIWNFNLNEHFSQDFLHTHIYKYILFFFFTEWDWQPQSKCILYWLYKPKTLTSKWAVPYVSSRDVISASSSHLRWSQAFVHLFLTARRRTGAVAARVLRYLLQEVDTEIVSPSDVWFLSLL